MQMPARTWLPAILAVLVVLVLAPTAARAAVACDRTWDGGGDGSTWEDAANWSGDAIPTSSQHACISASATTVTVRSSDVHVGSVAASLDVEIAGGGHLVLHDGTTVSTFTRLFVNGTIDGDGSVEVSGLLNLGGSLFGAGKVRVLATGSANFIGATQQLGRTLRLEGTATWSAGAFIIYPGGRIENAGTLDLRAPDTMYVQGEDPDAALVNSSTGTLSRTTGASTTTSVVVPLANAGKLSVGAGVLAFDAGGTDVASTGSYGATGAAGLLNLRGGEFTLGTDAKLAGHVLVNGTVRATGTATITDDTELRGALSGAGEVRIAGTLFWTAGMMWDTGTTRVLATGTLNINLSDPGNVELGLHRGHTLVNEGKVVWTAHSLAMDDGSRFENKGTLDARSLDGMRRTESSADAPVLANTGTITRTADADGTTRLGVPIDNDGVVESKAGWVLVVGDADGASTGRFGTAGTDGGVNLGGGLLLGAGAKLDGTTTVEGTLFTRDAVTVSGTSYLYGTLDGPGTYTVGGTLTWRDGHMTDTTGLTDVLAGGKLIVDSGSGGCCNTPDLSRTLRVEGAIDWRSGPFYLGDGAVLDVRGTFDARSPNYAMMRTGSGADAPEVRNAGTITRSNGVDSYTSIDVPQRNTGVVQAPAGVLSLRWGADAASTGRFGTSGNSGTVELAARTHRLGDGATLDGNVYVSGTLVTTSGTVRSNGNLGLNGNVIGSGRLDIAGTLDWVAGTMDGPGVTRLLPTATAGIHDAPNCCGSGSHVVNRTLRNEGTARWTSGTIDVGDGAVIENAGRFEALAPGGYLQRSQSGADVPEFVNTGTLARPKGNDSVTTFNLPLDNDGTVDLAAGRIAVYARYTQSADGILRVAPAGTVAAEDYGVLEVYGQARLGGKLALVGSGTVVGDAWDPLTYVSRRGTFASVVATLPAGQKATVDYRDTAVHVAAVAAAGRSELAPAVSESSDSARPSASDLADLGEQQPPAVDLKPASGPPVAPAAPSAARSAVPTIAVPSRRAFSVSAAKLLGRALRTGERLVLVGPSKKARLDRRTGTVRFVALVKGTQLKLRVAAERSGRRVGGVRTVVLTPR
jgi:hypothetical protein